MDLYAHQEVQELLAATRVHPRQIPEKDISRFEGYITEIFTALGLDLNTPATNDTPRRFIQAMLDVTEGYDGDPKLVKIFDTECHGGPDCRVSQLVEGPIHYFSLCEHHALPVVGSAYVGYIAHEHIIGLSKLVRVVHLFAKRFTVQERVGQQIADALQEMLKPHGVAIYLEARHLCTQMRGVGEMPAVTRTAFWRGNYDSNDALRSEFLRMCGVQGRGLASYA